jgi:hypothetical protein
MKKRLLALFILLGGVSYTGSFVSGSIACPSSGNKQVSTTSYFLRQLTVSALIGNTENIYIGGLNTSATAVPPIGGELVPGSNYNSTDPTNAVNPANLYFACVSSGDAISWIGRE